MALEAQVRLLPGAGLVVPVALEDEVVARAVRAPGIAVLTAVGLHRAGGGVGAVAVRAVHGQAADVAAAVAVPRRQPDQIGIGPAPGGGIAPGVIQHRVPGAVIAPGLALVGRRGLELHGLVGVLADLIGSQARERRGGGGAPGVSRHRPAGVVVAVVGVALEADLVLARDVGAAQRGARPVAPVALLDRVAAGQRAPGAAGVVGLHPPHAAQHPRGDVGVHGARIVQVRAGRRGPRGIEQAVFHHPVRVVTVRALHVAVVQAAPRRDLAQQRLALGKVLVGDIVHLAAGRLIGAGDGHVAGQGKVAGNIGHLPATVVHDRRGAVALVAGLLDGRAAPALGAGHRVGALAQQPPGPVHGVGVVTVQARRLPDLDAGGKLALGRRRAGVDLVGRGRLGMGRARPGGLVVAGQAHDVAALAEAPLGRGSRLETLQAQELDRGAGRRVGNVRVVAGGALHLRLAPATGRLQRHRRVAARAGHGDVRLPTGVVELAVGAGQRGVVGQRDGVVVGQIHPQIACVAGLGPRAARHGVVSRQPAHGDGHVLLPAQHVDHVDGQRAVVARQAQLGAARRLGQHAAADGLGVQGGRAIHGIGLARYLPVPQGRARKVVGPVRGMAEGADLLLAGGPHRPRARDGEIVLGAADLRCRCRERASGQDRDP